MSLAPKARASVPNLSLSEGRPWLNDTPQRLAHSTSTLDLEHFHRSASTATSSDGLSNFAEFYQSPSPLTSSQYRHRARKFKKNVAHASPRQPDLEANWGHLRSKKKNRPRGWRRVREYFFGSKIDRKIWNPASTSDIGYQSRKMNPWTGLCLRTAGFIILSVLISLFHAYIGLNCGDIVPAGPASSVLPPQTPERSRWLLYAEAITSALGCFVLAQGHIGMRATRERMERVRQNAITTAYSLLKTTRANPRYGNNWKQLQLIIYECLALVVAFPVTLVHQIRGKRCEPAITKYCHDAAVNLQRLRNKDHQDRPLNSLSISDSASSVVLECAPVDYYFEIFSLLLEKEYQDQTMTMAIPSMVPQHIIYNIRNHFENLVDQGNVDDRRAPIVRENIDLLALASGECPVFSYNDFAPVFLLRVLDFCVRIMAVVQPAQNCDWIINSTHPVGGRIMVPTFMTLVAIGGISLISATILTLLNEMWEIWDPFGTGLNTFGWTLGIAREVDDMVNEFDEYEEGAILRKHSYLNPMVCSEEESLVAEEFRSHMRRTQTL